MDLNRSIREQARENSRLALLDDHLDKVDRLKEATELLKQLAFELNHCVYFAYASDDTRVKDVEDLIHKACKFTGMI